MISIPIFCSLLIARGVHWLVIERFRGTVQSRRIAVAVGAFWWTSYALSMTIIMSAAALFSSSASNIGVRSSIGVGLWIAMAVGLLRVAYLFWKVYINRPDPKLLTSLLAYGASQEEGGLEVENDIALTLAAGPFFGESAGVNGVIGMFTGMFVSLVWAAFSATPDIAFSLLLEIILLGVFLGIPVYVAMGWTSQLERAQKLCTGAGWVATGLIVATFLWLEHPPHAYFPLATTAEFGILTFPLTVSFCLIAAAAALRRVRSGKTSS